MGIGSQIQPPSISLWQLNIEVPAYRAVRPVRFDSTVVPITKWGSFKPHVALSLFVGSCVHKAGAAASFGHPLIVIPVGGHHGAKFR